jgi:hypothetical protein
VAVTDLPFTDLLRDLSDVTQRALVALWDSLDDYGDRGQTMFYEMARPLMEAAAAAAQDATTGYLTSAGVTLDAAADPIFAADAAARVYDPFDRLARNLASGMEWDDALAGARTVVNSLGTDSVYRSSRDTIAQTAYRSGEWKRRLSGDCCQWCMKLSNVTFDFASEAMFGHANCRCVPLPVTRDLNASNATVRKSEGFDPAAEERYDQAQAQARVRRSARTARKRRDEAAAELATEADPARRLRLEQRVESWDVRAEAADKRLALMDT